MKDIPAIRGRQYIARLVAEGEHQQQDFKFLISDARKIARSISAFANNMGGRLLIGVKDNGTVAGIRNEEDIYMVEQAAERYCQPPQHVEFTAFRVDPGVIVIRASIARAQSRPVQVREADGSLHAYFRVADENIAATPLMVESWRLRDGEPLMFTLDSTETDILAKIRQATTPMLPREIALLTHRSIADTERTLARLAAIGMIDFAFDGTSFRIALQSD